MSHQSDFAGRCTPARSHNIHVTCRHATRTQRARNAHTTRTQRARLKLLILLSVVFVGAICMELLFAGASCIKLLFAGAIWYEAAVCWRYLFEAAAEAVVVAAFRTMTVQQYYRHEPIV